jgi:mono/diheme cytochrome c family protein
MRHLAVPRAAREATNPLPLGPDVLARARAHFADHCASCHGNDGRGQTKLGRGLYPKAPDMHIEQQDQSHVMVALTDATKYLRGKKPAKAADLVRGQRVAVTYRDEAGRKVAREVLLGVEPGDRPEKPRTPTAPHHD